MKFELSIITLGNAAMSSGEDLAWALRNLADKLERTYGCAELEAGEKGRMRDLNGNTVGTWRTVTDRKEQGK